VRPGKRAVEALDGAAAALASSPTSPGAANAVWLATAGQVVR
jgi:hypothetical protein